VDLCVDPRASPQTRVATLETRLVKKKNTYVYMNCLKVLLKVWRLT
jgi:hypothetical protein